MADPGLSARTLAIGLALGAVLAAANVYVANKTASPDQGAIPAVLIGYAVLSALARSGPRPSPHDGNIIQTVVGSAAMMAITGGVAGPIAALALAGAPPSPFAVAAWCAAIGVAGCLIAIPLRAAFVVRGALPFPSAVATAEVIEAVYAGGPAAARPLRWLAAAAGLAAAFAVARDLLGWIPGATMTPGALAGIALAALGIGIEHSPLALATGALLGARTGLALIAGAAIAWLAIAPALVTAGVVAGADYGALVPWLLWPGVGLMIGGTLSAIAAGGRQLAATVRELRGGGGLAVSRRHALAIAAAAIAVIAAGRAVFGVHPALIVLALALAAATSAAAARATGETDNTPAGALGGLGQIAVGAVAGGGIAAPLAGGAVVNGTAMQSSLLLGNWRTGVRLGTAPRTQLIAALAGALVGAAAAAVAFELIRRGYQLGGQAMPAVTARSWQATAEVMQHGLAALPAHAAPAAAVALAAGVVLGAAGARPRLGWLPSPVALGMAFVIPAELSLTMGLGGVALWLLARRRRAWCDAHATTVASGAIAGEATIGLALAALAAAGVVSPG